MSGRVGVGFGVSSRNVFCFLDAVHREPSIQERAATRGEREKEMYFASHNGRRIPGSAAWLWCVNAGHCPDENEIVAAVQVQVRVHAQVQADRCIDFAAGLFADGCGRSATVTASC